LAVLFTILYTYNILYNVFLKHNKVFPNKEHSSSIFLFFPLFFGSLSIGYYLYDYIDTITYNLIPIYIHYLPLFLLFIALIIYYFYINRYPNRIHIIFNRRFFIDSIYNYISYYFLYYSYIYLYKYIDRGILEYIGPTGIYRLIYNIKEKLIYQNQLINSFYLFIIFFFFLSIFFIFYY
jgi:NADH:ubiquinone oxidoreductase subunit 5 (subunit L)/multisubunit Na+/H+ antiporter MnhA subunit